jgi:very-short-patch-repair endonuclease
VKECWNYERNEKGPEEYAPRSGKSVWWRCSRFPKHEWKTTVTSKMGRDTDCPQCNISKGEKAISIHLEQRNIRFQPQKRFSGCRYKHLLSYDFYVPSHDLLIEYDGEQHFNPDIYFSKLGNYEKTVRRDIIKLKFALVNGFTVLRISYKEFKYISEILDMFFSEKYENVFLYDMKKVVGKDIIKHYSDQLDYAVSTMW